MPFDPIPRDTPSSVTQLAAAMAALGLYAGANTPAEHGAEARRLGSDAAYRLRLVNALRDAAQAEALVAESPPVSTEDRLAGPIPLAPAHAAEGLQQLLNVIADSQT